MNDTNFFDGIFLICKCIIYILLAASAIKYLFFV